MKIAIASGKGGTGKTLFSTNLAKIFAEKFKTCYADLDVEEPDGGIFLKPEIIQSISSTIPVPEFYPDKCTGCGACSDICEFKAISYVGKGKVLLFPELCHSCGGCALVCKFGAIEEVDFESGKINVGKSGKLHFVEGRLKVGRSLSPSIIASVKEDIIKDNYEISILDAPPGTTCPAVEAIKDCDMVVLVTEPTPFGMHDLEAAGEMVKRLGLRGSIIINRSGMGNTYEIEKYSQKMDFPIIGRFPIQRRIAEVYSVGDLVIDHIPEIRQMFIDLAAKLEEVAK